VCVQNTSLTNYNNHFPVGHMITVAEHGDDEENLTRHEHVIIIGSIYIIIIYIISYMYYVHKCCDMQYSL